MTEWEKMTKEKEQIVDELIDNLLKDYKKPEDRAARLPNRLMGEKGFREAVETVFPQTAQNDGFRQWTTCMAENLCILNSHK
ncbi:hypothetical protein BH10ACI2_BH10ACI2_16990 [soil metagenome]